MEVNSPSNEQFSALYDADSKRRFVPQYSDETRLSAALAIQTAYRGAIDRRHIQRILQLAKRMRGDPDVCFNFVVDGKKYQFAESSLCWLRTDNSLRKFVVQIAVNPVFDTFILICILLNAALMGLTDYDHVELDPSSQDYLQPITRGSWRNEMIQSTDSTFTVIFCVECLLKITAVSARTTATRYI